MYLLSGDVLGGLIVHPDNRFLIYPLGFNIIIEDISSSQQQVLSDHTNKVTCIAVDPSGRYIASGQINYMGFKVCFRFTSLLLFVL